MTRSEPIAQNRGTYVTQAEAADILGVTDRTIRNMLASGRLKGYRLGKRLIRLRLDEVESALRPLGEQPA